MAKSKNEVNLESMAPSCKDLEVDINELVFDYAKNWRHNGDPSADLGVESMMEQIIDKGGILVPIVINGATKEVWQGYRRGTAALKLLNDPDVSEDLKKKLRKLKVKAWFNTTPELETEIRFDDGAAKPLSPSEIISSYFRIRDQGWDVKRCKRLMFHSFARLTGNITKANQAELLRGVERDKFLDTWLKGTVEQWLEYARGMGPTVQQCLVMTTLSDERLPSEKEASRDKDGKATKQFAFFDKEGHARINRSRITQLFKATVKEELDKERKDGEMDHEVRARIVSRMMLHWWKQEHGQAEADPEPAKRWTEKVIADDIGARKSPELQAVMTAVGLSGVASAKAREKLADIDANLAATASLRKVVKDALDKGFKKNATFTGKEVETLLTAIAYTKADTAAEVEKLLASQLK